MKKSIIRIVIIILANFLCVSISNGQLNYTMVLVNEEIQCNKSLIELNNRIESINTINLDSLNLKTVGDLIDFVSIHHKLKGITLFVINNNNLSFTGIYLEGELNNKYDMNVYICFKDNPNISEVDKKTIKSLTYNQYVEQSRKESLDIFLKYYLSVKKIDKFSIFQSKIPKPMEVPDFKK